MVRVLPGFVVDVDVVVVGWHSPNCQDPLTLVEGLSQLALPFLLLD